MNKYIAHFYANGKHTYIAIPTYIGDAAFSNPFLDYEGPTLSGVPSFDPYCNCVFGVTKAGYVYQLYIWEVGKFKDCPDWSAYQRLRNPGKYSLGLSLPALIDEAVVPTQWWEQRQSKINAAADIIRDHIKTAESLGLTIFAPPPWYWVPLVTVWQWYRAAKHRIKYLLKL